MTVDAILFQLWPIADKIKAVQEFYNATSPETEVEAVTQRLLDNATSGVSAVTDLIIPPE